MLDLSRIPAGHIARILLLEDHQELDPENLGNDHNGTIDEAVEEERGPDAIRIQVTYSEVASDESSCFPRGEMQAATTLLPGENDAYRSGMVITFDEIDGIHSVILTGDHSGSGNSDESHEGYFCGWLTVVPLERRDEALAAALKENAVDELADMAGRVAEVIRNLHGHGRDEIVKSPLWGRVCELNRFIAGA